MIIGRSDINTIRDESFRLPFIAFRYRHIYIHIYILHKYKGAPFVLLSRSLKTVVRFQLIYLDRILYLPHVHSIAIFIVQAMVLYTIPIPQLSTEQFRFCASVIHTLILIDSLPFCLLISFWLFVINAKTLYLYMLCAKQTLLNIIYLHKNK